MGENDVASGARHVCRGPGGEQCRVAAVTVDLEEGEYAFVRGLILRGDGVRHRIRPYAHHERSRACSHNGIAPSPIRITDICLPHICAYLRYRPPVMRNVPAPA